MSIFGQYVAEACICCIEILLQKLQTHYNVYFFKQSMHNLHKEKQQQQQQQQQKSKFRIFFIF
jgi:hypothetical protein